MKKIYLLFIAILSFQVFGFAQKTPKFDLTKDGMKPIIVAFDTSYHDSVIYAKIKEWISLNNKNPQSVTRIDNKNSLVKFSCFAHDGWKSKINNVDYWNELQFTFAIEIKDARCRITFATDENRYKFWYNADGKIKDQFKESETTFENSVNKQLASLYDFMLHGPKTKKDDW